MLDSNANHVIQTILDLRLPNECVAFIARELERNFRAYSEHPFACRIVQSYVTHYGDELAVSKLFKDNNHISVSLSMYGNYVVQCIIAPGQWYSHLRGISKFRWRLITELFSEDYLLLLSQNKFGSNVVETCIRASTQTQLATLVSLLTKNNAWNLKQMLMHRFGNYVIKTLLDKASKAQQRQLIQSIEKVTRGHHYNVYAEIVLYEMERIKQADSHFQKQNGRFPSANRNRSYRPKANRK
jgi:hypothetical protein